MKRKILSIVVLAALLLSTSNALAGIAPPKPLFPKGTITDTTPTYKWKPVAGATKYRIQVLKDGSAIFSKNVNSSACSASKCLYTATSALAYGTYKWRVRAYENNSWTAYSSKKTFTLVEQSPGFTSHFTSSYAPWMTHNGTWSINSGSLYTTGVANEYSTASHTGDYMNITYSARMKRLGCGSCPFGLLLRGTPTPMTAQKDWNTTYQFLISNDGDFAVWKVIGTTYTTVKNWTVDPSINTYDWNTLKVIANDKQFKFYVNGTLLWKGKDASIMSLGKVGVDMYANPSPGEQFWVDWARVKLP